ncbi:MAG: DUF721 domain-containing protein [Planctomycetes bacterium]|nr:DUF721 domain-containing protein [Planctomycetota bacterium]
MLKRAARQVAKAPADPLQRLRANNPRKRRPPEPFARAVSEWLAAQTKLNRSRRGRVLNAWTLALADVMGEPAPQTELLNMDKGGTVHVVVESATLAHELGVVQRGRLLQRLRELLAGKDSVAGLVVRARSRHTGRTARARSAAQEAELCDEAPD